MKPAIKLFLLLALLLFFHVSCAGVHLFSDPADYRILEKGYRAADGQVMAYDLFIPRQNNSKERFPLVVSLPGSGVKIKKQMDLWTESALRNRVMVLTPQWSDLKSKEKRPGVIFHLVEMVAYRYPVDAERIYLSGDSAGAGIAMRLFGNQPNFWKAAIFVASPGKARFDLMNVLKDRETPPPILFVHGERDEGFLYSSLVRDIEMFKQKGVDVELISDPEAGHTHKKEWNEKIFGWIAKKTDARSKIQDTR